MATAYTGLPGSGKSHSVVKYAILPALKSGIDVYTNITLDNSVISEDVSLVGNYYDFDVSRIADDPDFLSDTCFNGSLIVIDEVATVWPAGIRSDQVSKSVMQFFTMERHRILDGRRMEIIVVCQDLAQLASFCRNLIVTTYHHKKHTAIGNSGRFRIAVFDGPVTGPNPPTRSANSVGTQSYDKNIFRYYTSHTLAIGSSGSIDEATIDGRDNIIPGLFASLSVVAVVVVIAFYVLYVSYNDLYVDDDDGQVLTSPSESVVAPVVVNDPVVVPVVRPSYKSIVDLLIVSDVYISSSVATAGNMTFNFRAINGDMVYTFSSMNLLMMGFKVQSFSSCFALIRFSKIDIIAGCQDSIKDNLFIKSDGV